MRDPSTRWCGNYFSSPLCPPRLRVLMSDTSPDLPLIKASMALRRVAVSLSISASAASACSHRSLSESLRATCASIA